MSLFGLFDALESRPLGLSDGATLATLVAVPEDPRAVVVMVHGFTGSKEDFVLVLPELAARGVAAVAYDSRGTYESDGDAPFTRERLAADLREVVDHAGQIWPGVPVHVVGHSYGGLVAQQMVADDPRGVASLVLLCTGPAGVEVIGADEQQITIGRDREFAAVIGGEGVEAAWQARATLENLDPTNPFVQFLRQRFVTTDVGLLMANLDDLLHAPDLVPGVVATGVPVRWAFGERDGSWAQSTQRAAAERYGTSAHVIPDAGHAPCLENDEATVAWLEDVLALG